MRNMRLHHVSKSHICPKKKRCLTRPCFTFDMQSLLPLCCALMLMVTVTVFSAGGLMKPRSQTYFNDYDYFNELICCMQRETVASSSLYGCHY